MADSFTANLNLRKPEVGAAHDTWGGVAGLNGDLDLIDAVFLATGLGTSVGLHIGSGKVLGIDGDFEVRDTTDPTKIVTIKAANVTTGTKRTLQAPDMDGTIATVDHVRTAMPVGTVLHGYWGATPPPGFVFADGRTIGDASSGASNWANADTAALFARIWSFNDATRFPMYVANTTTLAPRGPDAATDYAAHKHITLPDHSGAVAAGRDNLSGTSRGRLSTVMASTTWGVFGGQQQVQYAIQSGSFSGTFPGGTFAGTAFVDGLGTRGISTGPFNAAGGGFGVSDQVHQHVVNGNAVVHVAVSGAVSGSSVAGVTDTRSNVQPTVICDVVIAL